MSTIDNDNERTAVSGDNADSWNISRMLMHFSRELERIPIPTFAHKDLIATKHVSKKQSKIFAQHSLPIKKEVKPQFKQNYKPNNYINNNYHAKSFR